MSNWIRVQNQGEFEQLIRGGAVAKGRLVNATRQSFFAMGKDVQPGRSVFEFDVGSTQTTVFGLESLIRAGKIGFEVQYPDHGPVMAKVVTLPKPTDGPQSIMAQEDQRFLDDVKKLTSEFTITEADLVEEMEPPAEEMADVAEAEEESTKKRRSNKRR